MSLEKKIAVGLLALSSAAANSGCKDLNQSGKNTENYNSIELGGVTISEAVTDSEGMAYFIEARNNEEVMVEIKVKGTSYPISNVTVLYFDHPKFKSFLMNHPAYDPEQQNAAHNSKHFYSLTAASLPVVHESMQKEQSKAAAQAYLSWTEANWEHTGCFNRDNMITLMKPGVYLMNKLGIIETIGFSEEDADEAVQYIEKTLPASAIAEVYAFVPYQNGFSASTTTITTLDIKFNGKCGETPAVQDQECDGTIFCDTFNTSGLNANKWKIVKDAGITVSGGWLSLTNPSSIATSVLENSCKDKQVELRSGSYLGSVYLGNMGLSAGKTSGILSCGNQSKTLSLAGAQNGFSLYKSGGLLSISIGGIKTSVPCPEDISYVQLKSGLNEAAKFDYVKVRCK